MTRVRNGFALITVLWVMVAATTVVLAAALDGRDAFNAARNRVNAERARWRAQECVSRTRASLDDALVAAPDPVQRAAVWRAADFIVATDPYSVAPDCAVALEADGTRINVNTATDTQLVALFAITGNAATAPNLLQALRSYGPLQNERELALVPGFETAAASITPFINTESGLISINTASLTVLGAIPGFSAEALDRVAQAREMHDQIWDLAVFASSLSPAGFDEFSSHFLDISRTVTPNPVSWTIRASAQFGLPATGTVIEARIVRSNDHAVVVRNRIDP